MKLKVNVCIELIRYIAVKTFGLQCNEYQNDIASINVLRFLIQCIISRIMIVTKSKE
jgi:hypothetical protein